MLNFYYSMLEVVFLRIKIYLSKESLKKVVDIDNKKGEKVATELGVNFYEDYNEILDIVDVVSIVVPTVNHFKTAKAFLESGVHVLLEKPFAETVEEAETLDQIAREKNLCLQIGHLERFNPVFLEFKQLIDKPKFVENIRFCPKNLVYIYIWIIRKYQ